MAAIATFSSAIDVTGRRSRCSRFFTAPTRKDPPALPRGIADVGSSSTSTTS